MAEIKKRFELTVNLKFDIDNSIVKYDVIFGLASDKFNIENVNMILHEDLIGG